jgi:hypothetical protein
MGFFSFIKMIFAGESDEEALDAARARHGIKLTDSEKREAKKATTEAERYGSEYDVWEDLKNYRTDFFLGSWVRHKVRPVGEEKLKRDLEKLEKKHREAEERKKGEG